MSISSDLFLAILSMDSYNRNYGAGIEIAGNQIGNATILVDSETVFKDPAADPTALSPAAAAGFYAVAYTVGAGVDGLADGTTVISYRGTDGPDAGPSPLVGEGGPEPVEGPDEGSSRRSPSSAAALARRSTASGRAACPARPSAPAAGPSRSDLARPAAIPPMSPILGTGPRMTGRCAPAWGAAR